MSNKLQLPIVKLYLKYLQKSKTIPEIPHQVVPVITSGIEALGRGQDFASLQQFVAMTAQTELGKAMAASINPEELCTRIVTALGIDPLGFIKSPEQKAQEQQAMMQQADQQAMRDAAVRTAPHALNAAVAQQQQPQQ